MPDVRIRQPEIDSLARKLDAVEIALSADERALLLAVFRLASASLGAQREGEVESGRLLRAPALTASAARLSSAFRDAFRPIVTNPLGANPSAIGINIGLDW